MAASHEVQFQAVNINPPSSTYVGSSHYVVEQ